MDHITLPSKYSNFVACDNYLIVVYLVSGRRVGGKLSVMEASLEYHVVLHRAGGASALDNGSSKQAVLATGWRRSLSPQQETYL